MGLRWSSGADRYFHSVWWRLRKLLPCGCGRRKMYTYTGDARNTGGSPSGNRVRFYDEKFHRQERQADEFKRELRKAARRRRAHLRINNTSPASSSSSSSSPYRVHRQSNQHRQRQQRGFEPSTAAFTPSTPVQRRSTGLVSHTVDCTIGDLNFMTCSFADIKHGNSLAHCFLKLFAFGMIEGSTVNGRERPRRCADGRMM